MALKFLNNATFAGTVSTGGDLTIGGTGGIFIPEYIYHVGDTNSYFGFSGADTYIVSTGGSTALTINSSQNATFAGAVTVEGGILHLGKADTASGHINAKELMTFNIDTDNDDTNRYFGFYVNGESGSGTELLKILETGDATFAGDVTTDGIFKVDTAPDDNILEVTQSGRKMALKTSFAGDTVGSFWAFRVSNGNVNGGTTDALIVRPQNATFAGNVTVGHDLKMSTNGEIDWNAGAVKLIGTADDIKLQGGSLSITGDGSNAVTLTESGNGDFTIDAPDDIRLDAGGGDIVLKSAGTEYGRISKLSSDLSITSSATNSDILINPNGNGNVGIGTTSPSTKLDVRLSGTTGKVAELHNSVGYGIGFTVESDGGVNTINSESNQALAFATNGSSNERMRISSAGAIKFNTYTAGTLVSDASGNITVSSGGGAGGPYLPLAGGTMTGNTKHNDNVFSYWGNNDDLAIRHNATDTYIENYTGDLQIVNYADDSDIVFKSDNGSGGTTEYFRLDGGSTMNVFSKPTWHGDGVKSFFGNSQDLQIYHDGSHSRIADVGTGHLVINATDFVVNNSADTKNMIIATDGGSVNLYYNALQKFRTTSAGVEVTGNIDLPNNGAILFDNTNNTEQYYIRNGGGSQSSFQVGKGNPGSDIKLIIDDGGNVGIGTTNPVTLLDIRGAGTTSNPATSGTTPSTGTRFRIASSTGASAVIDFGISSSGRSWLQSTDRTDLGAEYPFLLNPNGGNVGIGTTSPEVKLTIKGDALNTNQPVRITNSVTDTHTGLFLNNTGGTVGEKYGMQFGGYNQYSIGGIFGVLDSVSGNTSGDITFDMCNGTSSGSLIERMRITHEGNVGIGTSSPNQKLQVGGNLHVYDEEGDTDASIFLSTGTSNVTTVKIASNGDSYINGGNVGIGTTSPTSKIHVIGQDATFYSNTSSQSMQVGRNASERLETFVNDSNIKLTAYQDSDSDGGHGFIIDRSFAGSGANYFDIRKDGSSQMRINKDGNVGIGTTDPGRPLSINSDTAHRAIRILENDSANESWDIGVDVDGDLNFFNSADTSPTVSFLDTGNATFAGNVTIGDNSASEIFLAFNSSATDFALGANGSNFMIGTSSDLDSGNLITLSGANGRLGIGTTSPQSKLQVAGGIQMANDTATASAAKVGTMRYRTGTEYVEVTGTEILPNPGFDTDTNWVKGTGWTIANGKASVDNASSTALSQPSFGVTTGKIYNVRIDVSNYTSGSLQVQFGASQVIASIGANGEYNYTVTSTITGGTFYLYGVGDCEFSVDNASVIEVTAEDASYADMCMQTGSSTYEWVNIVRNTY